MYSENYMDYPFKWNLLYIYYVEHLADRKYKNVQFIISLVRALRR